jgi:hypothetical protein
MAHVLQATQTVDLHRSLAGLFDSGHQQGGKDARDGDHDHKLDQGERASVHMRLLQTHVIRDRGGRVEGMSRAACERATDSGEKASAQQKSPTL